MFSQAWSSITSDSFILSTISGYKIPFLSTPVQNSEPPEFSGSDSDVLAMSEASSTGREINAVGREIIWESFKSRGIKEDSIKLLMSSITPSTKKQYEKPIREWVSFCKKNNYNIFSPNEQEVMEWLVEKFNEVLSYSSLNVYRSALSFLCGDFIGKSPLICRLLK
ncbi:Protein of unknown function, partial [Cotesia congregata]